MKRLNVLMLTLAALVAFSSFAHAGTPGVNHRQVRQHARIHQGVRSGELTRGEAARLRGGQRHVQRMKLRAKSDGVVTRGERARIGAAQNRQSHRIYRLKHNARTR